MKITKFLQVCIGLSMVLLSFTAFLNTIQPAHANEKEELSIENAKTNTLGKIMMDMTSTVDDKYIYNYVLVWDTETGKSKMYYFKGSDSKIVNYEKQLPANPLP